LIVGSMALGSLVSPIFCMIADRHFASQKVLMAMNFACAALLFLAALVSSPVALFVLLLLAMICYMPTWSLTAAVAMAHAPSEKFPQIRVFGSIGWAAAGLFGIAADRFFNGAEIDGTNIPLFCGAGVALVAALLNLTLPNTPPPSKGKPASIIDVLGLRALGLLKSGNFAFFMLISMLAMIPFTMYFSLGSQFFMSQGFKQVTATMNLGQVAEILIMLLVPIALTRYGAKWAITAGLGMLLVRYIAFLAGGVLGQTWMYYIAILVHGAIFGFLIVGGQVYVDKKAPPEIKAQAQGLVGLLLFGIGMFVGTFVNVRLIDHYATSSEPVAAGYTAPITLAPKLLTIADAKVSDVSLFGRTLSDTEVAVLANRDLGKAKEAKKLTDAASEPVKLDSGLLASGKDLSSLADRKIEDAMTFSAVVNLPAGEEPLSGTLFAVGEGQNAMVLGVEKDKLYWKADGSTISQGIPLPRGKDKKGNVQRTHVTAVFDGEVIKLYTNGAIHKTVNWNILWVILTAISAVLMAGFWFLFRDDVLVKPATAPEAKGLGRAEAAQA
jgi:nucleoside transporter